MFRNNTSRIDNERLRFALMLPLDLSDRSARSGAVRSGALLRFRSLFNVIHGDRTINIAGQNLLAVVVPTINT